MILRAMLIAVMMSLPSLVSAQAPSSTTAHGFEFTSIEGTLLPMESFQGKAVLIVNTASRCGFTRQYDDLQALWERYRDRGL